MLLLVRLCYRDLESILLHKKQGCVWQLVRRINDWILGVRGLRELTRQLGTCWGWNVEDRCCFGIKANFILDTLDFTQTFKDIFLFGILGGLLDVFNQTYT